MLVLDANVVLAGCAANDGLSWFGDEELVSPPLMWSEVRSVLHEMVWHGELANATALAILDRLARSAIEKKNHRRLGKEAWRIADELGLAKTYDTEYVALASLLDCRLITLDARLRRRADDLGFVIGPTELR